jgi:integrase
MRGKPSLIELSNSPYQWKARWIEGDKVKFRYFKKGEKGTAEDFIKRKTIEAENHGTKHGSVSDTERATLIRFREAIAAMPDPKPTLADCVDSFLASIANRLTPITISELVASRVSAAQTKGAHTRTLRDLIGANGKGGRLGVFAETFGDRQAATVTAREIELWANEKFSTDSNRRENLIRINGLFAHAVKRAHITVNPFGRIEMPGPSSARAAILTVTECAKLLLSCPARSSPAVAVQLFAGLRHAEAERLTWEKISFEGGILEATQRKGAGRYRELKRFVDITPTLKAWLLPHRQLTGPIFPIGHIEGKASIEAYRNDFVKARQKAGIAGWDENTLRHCFGSYRVAETNDLKKVSLEMGHTTEKTTKQHYLNAVTAAEGAKFWNLRPGTGDEKIIRTEGDTKHKRRA